MTEQAAIFEDDDDDTFDYDHKFFDHDPFPNECEKEVVAVETFTSCFIRRYNFCPMFFPGSLQDACQIAFNSQVIKERRPVLIYIHHDQSIFSNMFCSNIFCTEIIIEYLLENYIVWPWDITFDSNKNKLIQIWREIFSTELLNITCVEKCPNLIGIMRRSARANDWSLTSDYEIKLLLNGDTLTCTQGKLTCETLLCELINLKEEFDENEQALSFDFTNKSGLCCEIIFEITKYLSLNDAINAFSNNILSFVHKYETKIHISESSYTFINMIIRKIKLEHIISLHLNDVSFSKIKELNSSIIFTNVISLTLLNYQLMNFIKEYEEYFPNLIRFCLWYDNQVNFHIISGISSQFWSSIKRFEIHCAGPLCTHYNINEFTMRLLRNYTIEYFLLDVRHLPLPSMYECRDFQESCVLMITIDFIAKIHNIRHVHLIISNQYDLKKLLNAYEWIELTNTCHQLKKITLQVMESIFEDQQLIMKIIEIQNKLYNIRKTIKFQVVSM
ncbi:unnamed protein product [Rotaria sp. Silwood2]|nr:unnamed protein product [Rotaria sp. Silwood2]